MSRRFLVIIVAGLLSSTQASAQDVVPNVGATVGGLIGNLTATTDALTAADATRTAVTLNETVGDLHQGLTAGTPLQTNNRLGDVITILSGAGTGMVDEFLAGGLSASDLMRLPAMLRLFNIQHTITTGGFLETGSPVLLPLVLLQNAADNPGGLPGLGQIGMTLHGVSPFDNLAPFSVLGISGVGPIGSLPLPANMGGLPLGELPLPIEVLDVGTLTALTGGATLPGL